MSFLMFYVTHPDRQTAEGIGDRLVKEKLIACYNLMPIEACYRWKGNVEKEGEWVSILKTRKALEEEVEARVAELHPYETPCIIRWEVLANEEYAGWIEENTKG